VRTRVEKVCPLVFSAIGLGKIGMSKANTKAGWLQKYRRRHTKGTPTHRRPCADFRAGLCTKHKPGWLCSKISLSAHEKNADVSSPPAPISELVSAPSVSPTWPHSKNTAVGIAEYAHELSPPVPISDLGRCTKRKPGWLHFEYRSRHTSAPTNYLPYRSAPAISR
jgi:hypothetical protein